jgi:hypothetical protein
MPWVFDVSSLEHLLTHGQGALIHAGGWNKARIILDLPQVISCRDGDISISSSTNHSMLTSSALDAPAIHKLFTQFSSISLHAEEIVENGGMMDAEDEENLHSIVRLDTSEMSTGAEVSQGELDGDEIEEF